MQGLSEMAYDKEIRFRCRALFEVLNINLTKISEQESIPITTLSDWKNDGREEYGGIWIQGSKASNIEKAAKKLREELQTTSVYDEMKNNLGNYYGVTKGGSLKVDGILDLGSDNAQLQAQVETDITMLACIQADYFDAQMFKNSMLSSIVLNNQVKKDVTKVRQADIKASSEIHKIAKEARFGKSPDTVIVNANGNYTVEELNSMSLEQLEQLMKQEQQKALIGEVVA
jgi:hypothetical protein